MNKRLIISFGLFVLIAVGAAMLNFGKPADAAFIGSGMPGGSNTYTMLYNNGAWAGTSALTISGNDATVVGTVTANSFIYSSDFRLKKDIAPLNGALNKINNLQGVSFNWKNSGKPEIGLIAQDVEKVVPELVVTGSDGLKAVKYGNIVPLLIEAVKEQQVEINALKAEISKLSK